jgi:hypothetical protein
VDDDRWTESGTRLTPTRSCRRLGCSSLRAWLALAAEVDDDRWTESGSGSHRPGVAAGSDARLHAHGTISFWEASDEEAEDRCGPPPRNSGAVPPAPRVNIRSRPAAVTTDAARNAEGERETPFSRRERKVRRGGRAKGCVAKGNGDVSRGGCGETKRGRGEGPPLFRAPAAQPRTPASRAARPLVGGARSAGRTGVRDGLQARCGGGGAAARGVIEAGRQQPG